MKAYRQHYDEVVPLIVRVVVVEAELIGVDAHHHIGQAMEGQRVLAAEGQLHVLLPHIHQKHPVRREERLHAGFRQRFFCIVLNEHLRRAWRLFPLLWKRIVSLLCDAEVACLLCGDRACLRHCSLLQHLREGHLALHGWGYGQFVRFLVEDSWGWVLRWL